MSDNTFSALAPIWCKNYVFVSSENGFMNLTTGKVESIEAFNLINGKNVKASCNRVVSAFDYVAEHGFIRVVDSLDYRPYIKEAVFSINGDPKVNGFNSNSLPKGKYGDDSFNTEVIDRLNNHISYLCNDYNEGELLLSWIAHQVQNMGKKLKFCPVLIGFPGSGKGYVRALLREVLGVKNLGVVNPSALSDEYNTWAKDKLVNCLEELYLKGADGVKTINRIKPLITNSYVQINSRLHDPIKVANVTNYIGFTNYSCALPLTEEDRRYWIIKSRFQNISTFSRYLGKTKSDTYFTDLYGDLYSEAPQLREYLLQYPISPKFLSLTTAPMTQAKKNMIRVTQGN